MDEDLNVDWNLHVGGTATIDHTLTINEQLTLWANAIAPQFILQDEKNQPGGVAALDSNGKISPSVIPDSNLAFFYETTTQGATSYTIQHTPISDSSIVVFSDSGTVLFPTTDYTCANWIVTFASLAPTEYAIIWIVSRATS
jgi:hypothetical protein